MTTPLEAERIAENLTHGQILIMNREPYTAIMPSDWKNLKPTFDAFDKLHRAGLISFNKAAGLSFWMIDTGLGLAVRSILLKEPEL